MLRAHRGEINRHPFEVGQLALRDRRTHRSRQRHQHGAYTSRFSKQRL